MTTSDLFQQKSECSGCELCSVVCPKKIIQMQEDEEGFLYPHIIKEDECINCKRCLNFCPSKTPGRPSLKVVSSVGGFVNDIESVKESSSGGFSTAIGKAFINRGGIVYGVRYTDDFRAIEYDRAESIEELSHFRTSKYAQAYKKEVYENVKRDLNEGKRVLFVGLPCEVSALFHFIKERDNLFTISLICHGPTSQKVHRQFCDNIMKDNSSDALEFFSMRYKKDGWKPYYVIAKFNNGEEYLREFNKTDYDIAFKFLKRPSCSVCQYKLDNESFGIVADLVLGDFHAVIKKSQQYNRWGVSQASCMSEKGVALLDLIKSEATLLPIDYKVIASTNIALRAPIAQKKHHKEFVEKFVKDGLHFAASLPSVRCEIYSARTIRSLKHFLVRIRKIILKH